MRPLLRSLLPFLLLLAAGCGNGTLGDIWHSFPEEVFNPPSDGGGGGGGGGGGVTLEEVAGLAGGQNVTGTVKNIALATVAGETFAFLAAGTDGCHVVDVTAPDLVTGSSYVTTIRPSALTVAPAELAGGRVDAVAVVDNTFLVCVAVTAAVPNCVSVFNLQTLIPAATSSTADLSASFIPPTTPGTDLIAVTGDSMGKGGGVAGVAGSFYVATGSKLASAKIELTGVPPALTWTLGADVPLGTPAFTSVTDVTVGTAVGATAIFASGKRDDGKFAVALTAPGVPVAVSTVVESEVQRVIDDFVSTAGNYPLDLAFDVLNLYVTGNDEVFVYSVSSGSLQLVSTISSTGSKTISVAGGSSAFAVGAGDAIRVGTNVLGQARVTGAHTFPSTYTVRGVAVRSTNEGAFFLACAGTGGLRILRVPSGP